MTFDSSENPKPLESLTNHVRQQAMQAGSARSEEAFLPDAFRDALENSALVSITDLQGRIVYCNRAFQQVSQYTQEELLGKDHRLLNSGRHGREFWQQMWSTIARGNPWRNEVCNRAKDGSYYWVDTTINPMRNHEGKVFQYMSVRYDVTQRKEAEQKQAALIKDLEQYAFLTAHNLRRPLSSIMGLAHLIKMGAVEDNLHDVLDMLLSQCQEMDGVVNDMNAVLNRTSARNEEQAAGE